MGAYFRFYNDQRPHQALGYRAPGEVFSEGQGPRQKSQQLRGGRQKQTWCLMSGWRNTHLILPQSCPSNRVHLSFLGGQQVVRPFLHQFHPPL